MKLEMPPLPIREIAPPAHLRKTPFAVLSTPFADATCHLYDARGQRLCSCPCLSIAIAENIARSQMESLNLVESEGYWSGFQHGAPLFTVHTIAEFSAWKLKLKIK